MSLLTGLLIAHPLLNDNKKIYGSRYLNAKAVETDDDFRPVYESMKR